MKKLPEVKRHPSVLGWHAWLTSDDGKKCMNGTAAGEFLENRLWWAYTAGWENALKENRREAVQRIFERRSTKAKLRGEAKR
jgi:hypothetical protein